MVFLFFPILVLLFYIYFFKSGMVQNGWEKKVLQHFSTGVQNVFLIPANEQVYFNECKF